MFEVTSFELNPVAQTSEDLTDVPMYGKRFSKCELVRWTVGQTQSFRHPLPLGSGCKVTGLVFPLPLDIAQSVAVALGCDQSAAGQSAAIMDRRCWHFGASPAAWCPAEAIRAKIRARQVCGARITTFITTTSHGHFGGIPLMFGPAATASVAPPPAEVGAVSASSTVGDADDDEGGGPDDMPSSDEAPDQALRRDNRHFPAHVYLKSLQLVKHLRSADSLKAVLMLSIDMVMAPAAAALLKEEVRNGQIRLPSRQSLQYAMLKLDAINMHYQQEQWRTKDIKLYRMLDGSPQRQWREWFKLTPQ